MNTTKKILFLGPESTGKTTLASTLASTCNTLWVPEYMREYLQKKWDTHRLTITWEDILPIAQGQKASEDALFPLSNKYLFCDTSLFEIMVYSYIYHNKCHPWIEQTALSTPYDFIFLTNIDVPWIPDDLRDAPTQRLQHLQIFESFLSRHSLPYTLLSGPLSERIQKVLHTIT